MSYLLQLAAPTSAAAIIAATVVIGRPLVRRLGLECGDRLAELVWSSTIGLLIAGLTLTTLGLCGLLYSELVVALTIGVVAAAAFRRFRRRTTDSRRSQVEVPLSLDSGITSVPAWLIRVVSGGAVVALLGSFVAALAPPTAGDALCYHLELPKRYLQDHGLTHFAYSDNSTYPLLAEMWFAWGLALEGPITAQLLHWYCGVLLAGACYILALPIVGRTTALVAGSLVLLTPGINNQMTAALNDVALALYASLSVAAGLEAVRRGKQSCFIVAGLMLGGALSVKYTALVFGAACATVLIAAVWWSPERRRVWLRGSLLAACVAFCVASPWYLRATYYHGDPLYPFLSGGHSVAAAGGTSNGPATFPESKTPLGRGPSALIAAPWQMTMHPDRFGGRGHQLGPLFLMLLPAVALLPNAQRIRLAPLLVVAATYGAACVFLRQNVRFLFPIVPLLVVPTTAVVASIAGWPGAPRRIAYGVCTVVVLFLAMIPAVRARQSIAVALGLETRDDYLARQEPTAGAAAWANANLPAAARVLSQEMRAFYFEAPVTRERIFRRSFEYPRTIAADGSTVSELLRPAGYTHLLLAEGQGSNGRLYDDTLSRAVDREIAEQADRAPQLLAEFQVSMADGTRRRYRILALR